MRKTHYTHIHIILTWIVRATNKVLKKATKLNVWGLQYFFCAGVLFT